MRLLVSVAVLLGGFILQNAISAQDLAPNTEPIGPSSRKTPFAISEIHYKPAPRTDGKVLEFVEVYNSNPFFEDISGYRLTGDIDYTFPEGTILQATNFIVVAKSPADITSVYGITNVLGPYSNSLGAGTLRLWNKQHGLVLEIPYAKDNPWPVAADGTGHSLVLARASYGERDPYAWEISDVIGGSPGTNEVYHASPLRNVVINELLAHTLPPLLDYVELYNHSTNEVDISGCVLTDNFDTNKFVIPAGTKIPAGGFVYFQEDKLGFSLKAEGETVYLVNPDHTRVLDAVQYDAQESGVAYGRWPDGAREFYRLSSRTPGQHNSAILIGDLAINEIMYAPITGDVADEYIELYNSSSKAIDLTGWKFTSGINFSFPDKTSIPANGYLVIAKDAAHLMSNYTQLNAQNTLGDFGGSLSGRGELIALAKPELLISTNKSGQLVTNTMHVAVESVRYGVGGRWGNWSHQGGSSLELIDPRSNHNLAANWADSDETAKAPWTTIQATGPLDLGGGASLDELHVMLMGEGECLIDNVEVLSANGVNRITNSTFDVFGMGGWIARGNHVRTTIETNGGFEGGNALHIRASARGDTGANRVFSKVIPTLTAGAANITTIRAKARWLRGWPEILFRIHGNYHEATDAMPLPKNLGSPGLANSRAVQNAGPAMYEITHFPAVPATNQDVVVTARVHDVDGLTNLFLNYRFDPVTNSYTTVRMVDDGTGGDAVAGDGLYSATITAPGRKVISAFYIEAADAKSAVTDFPTGAPIRECVVLFGDTVPISGFATYRQWFTTNNVLSWTRRPALSNERVEGTFIYNNVRPIYFFSSKFSGSPYHQEFTSPITSGHYSMEFPPDDLLLGTENFNKIHAPGNSAFDDTTAQREQACYWLARQLGLPWHYRRFVAMFVNGTRRGALMEDAQTPGSDVVDEWFPDNTDGQLYKIQPWFEMTDAAQGAMGFNNVFWAGLQSYKSGGQYKKARYRWNWLARAVQGSANNYTNVFNLIDAANQPSGAPFQNAMDNIVNIEEWMRTFAVEHASGNWDSFGAQNSQNMYGYVPVGGKFNLLIWDWNIVLGNSGSWGPGAELTTVNGQDPMMPKVYNALNPIFRRAYWRGLKELCNVHFVNPQLNAMLDAKYNAILSNKVTGVTSPSPIKTFISQARTSILNSIKPNDTTNFVVTSVSTDNNVAVVTGLAPLEIKTLTINGVEYPVTWNTVTTWTVRVPMTATNTSLNIGTLDVYGKPLSFTAATNATYSGDILSPDQNIVINEILYNPVVPGSEFVELYNRSSAFTFDLSGFSINGLDYTFPAGSSIAPNGFLVLAKHRAAFTNTFPTVRPFDIYNGNLDSDGETLTLTRPGSGVDPIVINRVHYGASAPWAATAPGTSLQLANPSLDNSRPAAWVTSSAPTATPGASNAVAAAISAFPSLWLNELQPEASFTDAAGQKEPWVELYNSGSSAVSLTGLSLSAGGIRWDFPTGAQIAAGEYKVIVADGQAAQTTATELHDSFRLQPTSGLIVLSRTEGGVNQALDYLAYTNVPPGYSYAAYPDGQASARQLSAKPTPDKPNTITAGPVSVLINEWMASNTKTITDPADGNYDDWFELFNKGATAADLTGFYLTDNQTNKTQFRIPAGYIVPAGGRLLVWADNDTGQNATNDANLHVNFKLDKAGSEIGLFAADGTAVDLVRFAAQTSDVSEGRYPDGAAAVGALISPTPGSANSAFASSNASEKFTSVSISAGQLTLIWTTTTGASYQLEYKNKLSDAAWTAVGNATTATGSSMTTTLSISGASQRFYRFRKL